jgi:hypothetical protein
MAVAAELRIREAKMGVTWAARRDLRIVYVDQLSQAPAENGQDDDPRLLRLVDG